MIEYRGQMDYPGKDWVYSEGIKKVGDDVYLQSDETWLRVIPETVGVFTTRTYSDGKKIFTGDTMDCGCGNYPVIWDETQLTFCVDIGDEIYSVDDYLRFGGKVTGTIHDKEIEG